MQSYTYMWRAITARANQLNANPHGDYLSDHWRCHAWVALRNFAVLTRFDCWNTWQLKKRLTTQKWVCLLCLRASVKSGFREMQAPIFGTSAFTWSKWKSSEPSTNVKMKPRGTVVSIFQLVPYSSTVCDKVHISSLAANEIATSAVLLALLAWWLDDVGLAFVAVLWPLSDLDKCILIY